MRPRGAEVCLVAGWPPSPKPRAVLVQGVTPLEPPRRQLGGQQSMDALLVEHWLFGPGFGPAQASTPALREER
jgi:hypothetical protein